MKGAIIFGVVLAVVMLSIVYGVYFFNWTTYNVTIPNPEHAQYITYQAWGTDFRNQLAYDDRVYVGGSSLAVSQRAPIGETIYLTASYVNASLTDIDHYGSGIAPATTYVYAGQTWSLTFKVSG